MMRFFLLLGTLPAFVVAAASTSSDGTAAKRWMQEAVSAVSTAAGVGEFDRLNELMNDVVIRIEDDMVISEKVGLTDLDLIVDSLSCRDIRIGNVALDHSVDAATNVVRQAVACQFQE